MDTPWWGTPRQWLAQVWLARYIRRMDLAVVSGERSWQYAWRLGVPQGRIRRGLYGIDGTGCTAAYDCRTARPGGWPRAFLFVGRLDPVKGIRTLLDGYRRYRTSTPDPWPLIVCGTGPLQPEVAAEPGVDLRGFVQPGDLPRVWSEAGAFVMASNYDPWPLALVEACAAGLPVIHTDACGSAVEMVRPYYNGITIGTGDAAALARGMQWMHLHHELLPVFGCRAHELAAAYSATVWADRWAEWLGELTAA
jgi:glycosyltransferase involved in cell wall biosynthesis